MTLGHPRPLPGYHATPASYPVSVRRIPAQGHRLPSDPASRRTPLPSLAVPVISARRGLSPPTFTTCLAHKRRGGPPGERAALLMGVRGGIGREWDRASIGGNVADPFQGQA